MGVCVTERVGEDERPLVVPYAYGYNIIGANLSADFALRFNLFLFIDMFVVLNAILK